MGDSKCEWCEHATYDKDAGTFVCDRGGSYGEGCDEGDD